MLRLTYCAAILLVGSDIGERGKRDNNLRRFTWKFHMEICRESDKDIPLFKSPGSLLDLRAGEMKVRL